LSISAPLIHKGDVLSMKYFNAAAMLPKRVGLPSASAAHPLKSS
jgi:hypothetical protein